MGLREGGGDKNFRRPRGDKSFSSLEEEDDDCFLLKRSSSFARTFLFLCVCERGGCDMLALSLSHTHTELVI